MTLRTTFLRLVFFAALTVATVIGCGGPSPMRSALPPSASGVAPPGAGTEQEAALERAVAQAHQMVAGSGTYGVIDGDWVAPNPAPGLPG
jgi:predicted small lipoprotein YifL